MEGYTGILEAGNHGKYAIIYTVHYSIFPMSLRDTEVKLASLEDQILGKLGYREYTVKIGNSVVSPDPAIALRSHLRFSEDQIKGWTLKLNQGSNSSTSGNTITLYELKISREVPETTIRKQDYWYLKRGKNTIKCSMLSLDIKDSRYIVILGVIKSE